MAHVNRNWHLRWTIDAELRKAIHGDGLIFFFQELPSGNIEVTPENPLTLLEAARAGAAGSSERDITARRQRLIYEAKEAVRRARSRAREI